MNVDQEQSEQEFWGDRLARWPRKTAETLKLPSSAREYLARTGLPMGVDWHFSFVDGAKRPERIGSLVVVGHDWEMPICIDEKNDGEVVCLMGERGGETKHFNSSINFFGAFLKLYQWYRLKVRNLSPESLENELIAQGLVETVEQKMAAIDPSALQHADNAWSEILEQMRLGSL